MKREANTTLRLPAEPVSANGDIVLSEAFPGVTFDFPVCVRSIPNETNRIVVVERRGRVMVINGLADPKPEVFLDIRDRVFASDWITSRRTEGLSSIAFHPDFKNNGRFFVTYNLVMLNDDFEEEHYNRVSEFRASEDLSEGLPDSEIPYITQLDEGDGHNMNDLHFGPDGYLYIAVGDEGDGGTGGDEYNNAQRIDKDYFSAVMRIDVDKRPGNLLPNPHPANSTNYWVPSDNPFVGTTNFLGKPIDPDNVRTEFWAIGFRNAWRISFDPLTGIMYEGDVGQHGREEINRVIKGGNYGWAFREGELNGPKAPTPKGFSFIDPIAQYSTGEDQFQGYSVTGGVVYRGLRIPSLYGHLLFADYVSGNVWAMSIDEQPPTRPRWLLKQKGIASFGYDPRNGDILAVYHNETEPGKIYRLDVSGGSTNTYPETLAETGIFSDLETLTPSTGVVPYDVNLSFWSDGAKKARWFSIPKLTNQIHFYPESSWLYPAGMTWIKHFDLETEPGKLTRVETRVLVKSTVGTGIYGLTYKWDETGSNATLVGEAGEDRDYVIESEGGIRTQTWRYPARTECLACHTSGGGLALAFSTAQLNKSVTHGSMTTNQIGALAAAGYFDNPPSHLRGLRALAATDDDSVSRTYRVRSYLAANCAFCHQPGGSALAKWDARAITPLSFAHIVDGALNNNLGNASNRVVVPGSPDQSALLLRISSKKERMPPVGSNVLDEEAIQLLTDWITKDLPTYELFPNWAKKVFADNPDEDSSEMADPDGDGATNYDEFLAGTNPLSSESRLTVSPQVSTNMLTFSILQPPNRALLIESAHSLADPYWDYLVDPHNTFTFPLEPLTRSVTNSVDGRQKFWRIKMFEP